MFAIALPMVRMGREELRPGSHQLRGVPLREAIIEANRARLRPILMTTMTLIAGMSPIALGTGPGAAARASLAKVIIGGQALSLFITLMIVPVAYSTFEGIKRRLGMTKDAPGAAPGGETQASPVAGK